MLPSASVRQMPSSVESISADWSAACVRCARSLSRIRRPTMLEPTAKRRNAAIRIPRVSALSEPPWVSTATIQSPSAAAAAATPPAVPTS